jgi:hypothetical protein
MSNTSAVKIHIRSDSKHAARLSDEKEPRIAFPRSACDKIRACKDLYQNNAEYREGFNRLMIANPLFDGLMEGAVLMVMGLVSKENSQAAMTLLAVSPLAMNAIASTFFMHGSHWSDNAMYDAINQPDDKRGELTQKLSNATTIQRNAWVDVIVAMALAAQVWARRSIPNFGPISTTVCLGITKTVISGVDLLDSNAWRSTRARLDSDSKNPWDRTVVRIPNTLNSLEMTFSTMVYAIGILLAYQSLTAFGVESDWAFPLTIGSILLSGVFGAGPRISFARKRMRQLQTDTARLPPPTPSPLV